MVLKALAKCVICPSCFLSVGGAALDFGSGQRGSERAAQLGNHVRGLFLSWHPFPLPRRTLPPPLLSWYDSLISRS
jgi:hypothetical protein